MSRIVTISFTGLDAAGGVPAFNRALHAAFPDRECVHFCWDDCPHDAAADLLVPEWHKARVLNQYLVQSRRLWSDDVIIADGFWADGLEHLPKAISHSHGIWSHLTKDDVDAGKEPDMPFHHAAQVAFRRKWTRLGKPLTAVSDFIAEQMRLQWGWDSHVINNGVDTEIYRPMVRSTAYSDFPPRPLIIHGVNDRGNLNKGWDHIELLKDNVEGSVLSLDEAFNFYSVRSDRPWEKHQVLAQADLVVHPSAFEGNSMFVAEALACGVPVIGYDVGFLWKAGWQLGYPTVMCRKRETINGVEFLGRSPECTLQTVKAALANPPLMEYAAGMSRELALKDLGINNFRAEWQAYVEWLETEYDK